MGRDIAAALLLLLRQKLVVVVVSTTTGLVVVSVVVVGFRAGVETANESTEAPWAKKRETF